MSRYVVDASVAVKLYIPEVHSAQAIRFFSDEHELIAPDLMLAEFANIVWKKAVLLGELTKTESETIVLAVQGLPLKYYSASSANNLLFLAMSIAVGTTRTLYDSLYVALAWTQECQLMTDDRKLFQALQSTPMATHLTLIENY